MERLTSGFDVVDDLIHGVRVGDNLVVRAAPSVPVDLIAERCIAASRGVRPLVVCRVARPWRGEVPDDVVVLDWHAVLSGTPSSAARALAPGAGVDAAREGLARADDQVGAGAVFVIDSLTAVQEAWGAAGALDLFLWACPRLFRRRSVALWPLERARHRPSFLRRLEEITQVVVDIHDVDGGLEAEVLKADGRPPAVTGGRRRVALADDDLRATGPLASGRQPLGAVIRSRRTIRGLAQAELARRVGISPSALSQVERGVRGLSGDSLTRIWEVLGVPFGPAEGAEPGYRVARRGAQRPEALADGMSGSRLVDDPAVGALWWLTVAPGAGGRQAPFAVKGTEVAVVLRGVVDLEVGGHGETLHEGDALVASSAVVTGWRNPASTPAEMLWLLLRTGAT